MKTKFIMIRHGFSVANNEKRFAGHSDFPLTDLGKIQAERCAEALKDEKIDVIYASDLSRAFETAVPIARSHKLEIVPHKGLREIFAGEWEGKAFSELEEEYPESFGVWKNDLANAHPDGGESICQLYNRILATMKELANENEGKTICIATHATPVRSVCTASMGLDCAGMSKIGWSANASISIFEYEDGKFTALEASRTEHLGDLTTKLPKNV